PLLQTAAQIVATADIFVVIGTSLQVYPAASLINYTPKHAKKFIIDKKIPALPTGINIEVIEAPASDGVQLLTERLNSPRRTD
ncbi:MAG: hypothetical protein RL596_2570, partial [Bacteroidota bacterium]